LFYAPYTRSRWKRWNCFSSPPSPIENAAHSRNPKRPPGKPIGKECLAAGRRSTAGFEDSPPLHRIMVTANLRRLSMEELRLARSGMLAQQEGRVVSAGEAAALRAHQCAWERLCEMAGYCGAGN